MSEHRDDHGRLLNAMLDGEATPEQERMAEELVKSDPGFSAALERLRLAESRLASLYSPATAALNVHRRGQGGANSAVRAPWRLTAPRVLAYAALLALASAVVIFALSVGGPVRADLNALHRGFVLNPTPTTVCDTPEKFLVYARENLGAEISARFDPGVTFVGWRDAGHGYDGSSRVRLLMAYGEGGEPIVVLFQPAGGPAPQLEGAGLELHRTSLGGLEIWEATPLDGPRVIPRLFVGEP